MAQPYTPNRNALLITAILSAAGSIPLFIYRPIPPLGLFAAIELDLLAALLFWQALFPKQVQWLQRKTAKWGKGTDDPNEPARWVP